MQRLGLGLLAVFGANVAFADELSTQCQVLYNELTADLPVAYDQCEPVAPTYVLETCEAPVGANTVLSSSHLILAIDASGSMAGQIGGESKMAIAQREALSFLQELDENISVGLVVYGHKGSNQEAGRAESCASSEMIHGFDEDRADLAATIQGITPTGWTPIGGVIEYAGTIIADLDGDDGALSPVIYVISDGEETCDSDPVAAAGSLFNAGVQTTVNTIGFAVDQETQRQLAAVAEAGGGTFYPADNASVLRQQLRAIQNAEIAQIRYEQCVSGNANKIWRTRTEVSDISVRCYNANDPSNRQTAMLRFRNAASSDDTLATECGRAMFDFASDEDREARGFLRDVINPYIDVTDDLVNTYLIEQGFPPRLE